MAHIHPKWLNSVAAEVLDKPSSDPFFSAVLPEDRLLNRLFLELSTVAEQKSSRLEQDIALWDFLSCLISRYALDQSATRSSQPARQAVVSTRDYLQSHYSDDVSLDDLAAVAGLSRFHFCRLFRKEMGVSASTYQTQLRLAEARRLLAQGTLISETAIATGFYDQSHFGKHFKRHVGTTPARYTSQIAISS
jgi:AraC-like DNA-binding protein